MSKLEVEQTCGDCGEEADFLMACGVWLCAGHADKHENKYNCPVELELE